MPNFLAKAQKGERLKVGYLGGSITAQEGWRVFSLEWLNQRFPKSNFSEVNAAIGGTASDFGAYRLRDQVLQFQPDLVFVEFAVNDSQKTTETTLRAMEGIVRQIWQHDPRTDICFVYTIKDKYLAAEMSGQLPSSKIAMEKIADHYGIPTINFGTEVARLVVQKQLVVEAGTLSENGVRVFSRDGVHPYPETGHRIYHEVLTRSFEKIMAERSPKASSHPLPKSLSSNPYEKTHLVSLSEIEKSAGWEVLSPDHHPFLANFSKVLSEVGKADQTGTYLALSFKGTAIGAYDIKGPSAGKVVVEIDGVVRDTVSRFDAYCTYYRMSYFLIEDLEDTTHEVVFKALTEPFDKAAILAQREKVIEKAEDYAENNWYVGKILMNGELVK